MGNFFCCVKVEQSTVAIKERFGKYQNVLQPGCHCVPWFLGDQLAGHLSPRVQQLDVRCETKTKDCGFVNVILSIRYRVMADKANDAFYKLSNTKDQIQGHAFDVIRGIVPTLSLDDIFGRKNFAGAVKEELDNAMSAYGYTIVQTCVIAIELDERVKKAIKENNADAWMRVIAKEMAKFEMNLYIKRAEGERYPGLAIAGRR